MTIPVLGDIIKEVGDIVEKVVPDADKKMDIQLELARIADAADAREDALLQAQAEINKTEAASGNLFVAGWRPAIGWTSALALLYTWIVAPVGKAVLHLSELPAIPTDQIYPIVLAMLGIAGMRTYEKVSGVATGVLGRDSQVQERTRITQVLGIEPNKTVASVASRVGKWFK